jgi:uncharacterized membrane protein
VQRLVRNDERGPRQCGWRDAIEHILRDGDAVKRSLGDVPAVDRDRGPAQAPVGARHGRKHMRADRLVGIADRDRNLNGRIEHLTPVRQPLMRVAPHVKLLRRAADEDRNRLERQFCLACRLGGVGLLGGKTRSQSRLAVKVFHCPLYISTTLGASAIRGFVQPVIKLGLERWHNPIAAVVIGYTVSSMVLILAALVSRQTLQPACSRRGLLWFAAVGLCNGSAVLSMYPALGRGPVTLISPLVATYPLVTLLLSFALAKHERIDAPLMAGVTATVGGVVLLLIT